MPNKNIHNGFLNLLKAAISNSSVYFEDHPILTKSVQNLKKNIDETILEMNPIKIGISSSNLFIGNQEIKDEKKYKALIDFLHRRRVKIISIKKDVTLEELSNFIKSLNLTPEEIRVKGGIKKILNEKEVSSINVDTLDYSKFLEKGEGTEIEDVWSYLLEGGGEQGSGGQTLALADKFVDVIDKVDIKEFFDKDNSHEIVSKLLTFLKKEDKQKFNLCTKGIVSSILKNNKLSIKDDYCKFKKIIDNLEGDDISDVLMELLKNKGAVNTVSLNLFFGAAGTIKHKEIISSMKSKTKNEEWLKHNPDALENVKGIFTLPGNSKMIDFNTKDFSLMLNDINLSEGISFDRIKLEYNYRYILIDLLVFDNDKEQLSFVINSLLTELDKAVQTSDITYVNDLMKVFDEKKSNINGFDETFKVFFQKAAKFIENSFFLNNNFQNMELYIKLLKTSSFDLDFYIDKIFEEKIVNTSILRLFFKFFPNQTGIFYRKVDERSKDLSFIRKLIGELINLDSLESWGVLKSFFGLSNEVVKIEILKEINRLSVYDEEFLYLIFKKANPFKRKYIYKVLVKKTKNRQRLAEELFCIKNLLGFRNKIVIENLELFEEVPFDEGMALVETLSKSKVFWYKIVRDKARGIV